MSGIGPGNLVQVQKIPPGTHKRQLWIQVGTEDLGARNSGDVLLTVKEANHTKAELHCEGARPRLWPRAGDRRGLTKKRVKVGPKRQTVCKKRRGLEA